MQNRYETLGQCNYSFVSKKGKEYTLLNNYTKEKEVFFHNQHHASWGIIYNGKHLEFARTLPAKND
jgi:hypothetical protein